MHLLGVRHETVGKKHLSQQIPQLPKGAKKSLYFLYSEFYLRANRNPFYLETINNADYLTTDGRGARWAQSKVTSYNFGPDIYQKVFLNSWGIIRIPAFILLFCIQLCANFLHGVYFFLIKKGAADSEDKLVLGRDYVYDLLHFANEQEWKVQIVAGARESKRKTLISKLQELYPHITIDVWSSDPDSDLMRDNVNVFEQVEKGKYCEDLTRENVLDLMPELSKAKKGRAEVYT
jgi:UDP-N-acetyl-D-mannosaminuronic acid transferase (WecB/TagA/CpsF family)